MMESTDWQGGFRDRELVVSNQQRDTVAPAVDDVIQSVKAYIFPYHSLF
jgi:hypothetical protein